MSAMSAGNNLPHASFLKRTASIPPCRAALCVSEEPVPQTCGRVASALACAWGPGDVLRMLAAYQYKRH